MYTSKALPETQRLADYLCERHDLKATTALVGMKTDQILLQHKEGMGYYGKRIAVIVNYIDKTVKVQLRNGSGTPVGGIAGYQGVNSIDELCIIVAMYADLLKKN